MTNFVIITLLCVLLQCATSKLVQENLEYNLFLKGNTDSESISKSESYTEEQLVTGNEVKEQLVLRTESDDVIAAEPLNEVLSLCDSNESCYIDVESSSKSNAIKPAEETLLEKNELGEGLANNTSNKDIVVNRNEIKKRKNLIRTKVFSKNDLRSQTEPHVDKTKEENTEKILKKILSNDRKSHLAVKINKKNKTPSYNYLNSKEGQSLRISGDKKKESNRQIERDDGQTETEIFIDTMNKGRNLVQKKKHQKKCMNHKHTTIYSNKLQQKKNRKDRKHKKTVKYDISKSRTVTNKHYNQKKKNKQTSAEDVSMAEVRTSKVHRKKHKKSDKNDARKSENALD